MMADECFERDESLIPDPKICGSVYIQENTAGLASYHFDSEEDCYISYASPECDLLPSLDNGERPPVKQPFTNFSIDESERIFKGDVIWDPTSWNSEVVWSYEMCFSEDYGAIISGKLEAYDGIEKENIIKTYLFGVDLKYKRQSKNTSSDICPVCLETLSEKCITPCGHIFCKQCIILVLSSEHGDKCPSCRTAINYDNVKLLEKDISLSSSLPSPKICGSVYIQGNTVGLASYHFESEEDCYISYASPDCDMWPDLDNGERPPAKKPFTNFSINESERIFKGDIIWAPTSWSGDVVWSYEMHFSEDFRSITSGTAVKYDAVENGNITGTWTFGVHLRYKRNLLIIE